MRNSRLLLIAVFGSVCWLPSQNLSACGPRRYVVRYRYYPATGVTTASANGSPVAAGPFAGFLAQLGLGIGMNFLQQALPNFNLPQLPNLNSQNNSTLTTTKTDQDDPTIASIRTSLDAIEKLHPKFTPAVSPTPTGTPLATSVPGLSTPAGLPAVVPQ